MDFPKLPEPGEIDSLDVLFTLLPGLLTYLVVRGLCARGKKIETAEAILSGLAYTLVVHAIWYCLREIGSLIPTPEIVGLSLTAVGLGLGVSALHSSGRFYSLLRRLKVTTQPSWVTVWESAFSEHFYIHGGQYAVLHLRDGRRVMGAIRGYSPDSEKGHVCLQRVMWLPGRANEQVQSVVHPGMHIFSASDIAVVEFLLPEQGEIDARRKRSRTANPATT